MGLINEMKLVYRYLRNIDVLTRIRKIKILNDKNTIKEIINTKKAVARFGDGELNFIFYDNNKIGFQDNSKELTKRLKEILNSKNDNVLIGLPDKFVRLFNNTYDSKDFWLNYVILNEEKILKEIDINRTYINTNFTRFYMDYKLKCFVKNKVKMIKKIWDNRDIVIVEGDKTKLGVGNDFFSNAKSIKRIICPNKNAFLCYDKILNECKKIYKDKLILIALGPTATVLAYDLGVEGYQAIDVGHVDIEYEWYLLKAKEKVAIDGKFVNEVNNSKEDNTLDDASYKKSIITVIKM